MGFIAEPCLAEGDAERFSPPAPDDYLVFAAGPRSGQPVAPPDVRADVSPLSVWPMSPDHHLIRDGTRHNEILLVGAAAGSRHSIRAFSGLCTHAGCAVSGWRPEDRTLVCPCHGSGFSVDRDGAVAQGPAARRLPGLQVKTVGGYLRVAATFDGRVGGDTGRTM